MNTTKAMVILNPYASRWRALDHREAIESAFKQSGMSYELRLSEWNDHARQIAREAVMAGFSPIVAAGGDGTVGEVVNGIVEATARDQLPPLGIMPLGTANDLADNVELPYDIPQAVAAIHTGHTRMIDICQVNDRYFINNAGLGLEPFITTIQSKMKRLRGNLRYIVAALVGIVQNPKWRMSLTWDGGSYAGPITMVSVGNCPRTGGVFFTVPDADPFDGKLSFVYGYVPTRREILRLFPMLMKPAEGNYTEHPAVNQVHCTWLKVVADQTTPLHADGEIQSLAIQHVEYRVFPQVLPLIVDQE